MTAWAGAIPFAQPAPVAIAYSQANPEIAAHTTSTTPGQSFAAVASVNSRRAPAAQPLRLDWRSLVSSPTPGRPADPTPVQLSTPAPQDDPTNAPEATPKPDPTATLKPTAKPEPTPTPRPTDTPEPTATATPKPTATSTPKPTATASPKPTATATPKPSASPTPVPTPAPTNAPTNAPTTYTGTSHFWYPALNIDTSWGWYGCDYGGPNALPGGIWRWGCAPANNIYLLSHAWSTFKKIKTAYHSGALQEGQNVWYANAQGDVTKWEVKWIRRVTDEYLNATAGEWAMNDSPTPIMTLQTCDGSQDQYRIIVRLVRAN